MRAGRAQHEPTEIADQPCFLGDGDELRRRDHPALGMPPADQRFRRDDPARASIDERLKVHGELVGEKRLAKVGFHPRAFPRRLLFTILGPGIDQLM